MKRYKLSPDQIASLLHTKNRFEIAARGLYLGMGFVTIRAIQAGLIDIDGNDLQQLAAEAGYAEGSVELYDSEGRKLFPPEH